MKKETQFLCIILLCGLSLMVSGCGIRPSKLMSPTEVEQEKTQKTDPSKLPKFPEIYPKAAR
jgi:hypothetical protein